MRSILEWPRPAKSLLVLGLDFVLLSLSLWTAIGLRLDVWTIGTLYPKWIYLLPSIIAIPVFIKLGLYRAVIRYMEDRAILTMISAVTVSVWLFAAVTVWLGLPNIPRGAWLIYWLLAIVYILLSRFVLRSTLRMFGDHPDRCGNVVIYGAGSAGRQLVAALRAGGEYVPMALVDDNPAMHGLNVAGLKVHASEELPELITDLQIKQVLLAIPSASRNRRIELVNRLEPLHVEVRALPGMAELVSGGVRLSDVREVEIEELLGREAVPPVQTLLQANIKNKSVMVTGAGGSIGSELCRQIVQNGPIRIVLYEQSEFALYSIEHELRQAVATAGTSVEIVPVLGSVQNGLRVRGIMSVYQVQTVYHAAAYKHVPIVEFNMTEGIFNNTFGTRAAAEAAISAGVETFVLISTDKAVRPTNVMGASKRMAELVLQAYATDPEVKTRFSMVRFGNVLGSSGSVVPLFRRQIAEGGPVTVTHPDIIRYFMTIPEAAQLVIQAGAMGESGEVFVLDMGKPVKIVDLASRMIHLSGYSVRDTANPDGDIGIEFSGLRPGEKLYEELLIGEDVTGTEHPRIMKAREKHLAREELEVVLAALFEACSRSDMHDLRDILLAHVSGFRPETDIRDHLHEHASEANKW